MIIDEMPKGLSWARGFAKDRMFCLDYVCGWIAKIAGGDRKQYKSRAARMIKYAKQKNQIENFEGSKKYYVFKDVK